MTTLRLGAELAEDFVRVAAHLAVHDVPDIDARLGEIVEALQVLTRHPLIGRPVAGVWRELVIGRASRGYVARYWYDAVDDAVSVTALRAQREAGFGEGPG
ncbi:MAG: type II toxin-antitoxin system RelE/ParE family toxin [Burkholderiales bacterium]